jgi:hypothetical protein
MQLRCDLPLSQDQGHARRPLDAWHLPWRVVMAHRGGEADGVDVAGMPVAIALRYSDDEPSSPWTWILYLDERATDPQRAALEDIFTGQRGGDAATHFPWAWKPSKLVAVRAVAIDVDHTRRRQRLRIRNHVSVRIRDRHHVTETVTCTTFADEG